MEELLGGYCLIIVDMVRDNAHTRGHATMDLETKKIIPVFSH
jgi:hypothetical protein